MRTQRITIIIKYIFHVPLRRCIEQNQHLDILSERLGEARQLLR